MPQILTNYSGIPLPLAVWLASDNYDYDHRDNAVSATGIMKPIKAIILGNVVNKQLRTGQDLIDLVPSRMGTALHDAIEGAWKSPDLGSALVRLGYPNKILDRVKVNPPRPGFDENDINVWVEQRAERELDGIIIRGMFDLVYEYGVEDYKSTGTYNWVSGSNDESYRLQGSIYRWLNQDIIRSDFMKINFIFTDWSALKARADKRYPQRRVEVRMLELLSIADTEQYLRTRIAELKQYWDKPEKDLPSCTSEELWQRPSSWAYYKNPKNTNRATKVFDNMTEAEERRIADGSVGMVVHRPGEVKRCRYCNARPICKQAETLQGQGLLQY